MSNIVNELLFLKLMTVTEKHIIAYVQSVCFLALRYQNNLAIDQSLDQWSSAGCWLHFIQKPFQLMDVLHWFLIFSRCLQVLVHWCGFHAASGESEWCIGLLLWRLAAQTVATRHLSSCWWLLLSSAPRVHKSTELLRHKTPDFTPDLSFVDPHTSFVRKPSTK